MKTRLSMIGVLICILATTDIATAEQAKVTPLLSRDLVGDGNKEVTMLTVALAPGESDASHRHNAQVFVYVFEGTVTMQLKGQKQVTLMPGQTFYEGPDDIHIIGRNTSATKPAKFLVFFVKKKGAPILIPVNIKRK